MNRYEPPLSGPSVVTVPSTIGLTATSNSRPPPATMVSFWCPFSFALMSHTRSPSPVSTAGGIVVSTAPGFSFFAGVLAGLGFDFGAGAGAGACWTAWGSAAAPAVTGDSSSTSATGITLMATLPPAV